MSQSHHINQGVFQLLEEVVFRRILVFYSSLCIARKISFGSQSDAGAKTREILMTVLHTLKKRTTDVTIAFKSALDRLAEQGDINSYKTIFCFDSS